MKTRLVCSIAITLLSLSCSPEIDLIIQNSTIYTVDPEQPMAEAVAVRGNRIHAVGTNTEIANIKTADTRVFDAGGRLLLPGFNDAHLHFLGGGRSLLELDLSGCSAPQDIVRRIKDHVADISPGTWITGRGWDHTVFNAGTWPDKSLLDQAAPDHPVFVRRVDGHVGWANSRALELANIDASTPQPANGEIVVRNGQPTGILKETAMQLMETIIPPWTAERKLKALREALQLALEKGVTSIQDNSGMETLALYHQLAESGELTVRVEEWLDFALLRDPNLLQSTMERYSVYEQQHLLEMGLLKGFLDGTLGSRTAWFFEPYSDDPSTVGLPQFEQQELLRLVRRADSLGLQVGLHAIGSRANWMALNAYENEQQSASGNRLHHRIEHAQVMRQEDIVRMAELGVVASMQPTHCTSDLRWAEQRVGHERSRGAYAWKTMLEQGVMLAFGTDWPVEPLDPMRGICSAVTRQHIESGKPSGGWIPEEKVTVEQAIYCYTMGSAVAQNADQDKGSVSVGKLADLVLLSNNIFEIQPEEILATKVDVTIFDGEIVYQRQQ